MPKSRGRRPHKPVHARPRRGDPRAAARAKALADFPIIHATDQAEARGDAMAAMELIEHDLRHGRGSDFWRPGRVTRLAQLGVFRQVLPRWATSRWILELAAQSLDDHGRHRARKALEIAVETRGGEETLIGADRLDARVKILDHDWVYRQVLLYELGALEDFLARVASLDLVAGADRIHDWARAPMNAFRFVAETPRTLTWREVATGEEVTSTNIGSASLLLPDECAIGRLVAIDEGAMFETAPLFVPDDVAQRVADDPRDWVAAVADGCAREVPPNQQIGTHGHHFQLLTDVPFGMLFHNVRVALEQPGRPSGGEDLDDDPIAAEAAFVRLALDDELDEEEFWANPWPSVAVALLNPSVFLQLVQRLDTDDASKLDRLAGLLASPADEVCRVLALDVGWAA